ncbi:GAF and ANTAR domain-containing protein [Streptomyces sp. NPDC006602]|uniref:GAF and ANTAR domain-containing protein n=1 Tax=Streptomyces sp. NPDC006602 TaxID=3364751 RepID=UPI0036BEEEBD
MPDLPCEERLAAAFVELADTLVSDFDVIHFLHTLSDHCVALLDIEAAGVILATPQGGSMAVAGSDARTRELVQDGVDWDEGPCHDCFKAGELLASVALDLPEAYAAWPRFAPRARDLGFRSVAAVPLRLREQTIGALNLLRGEADALAPQQLGLGRALADIATIGILQQRAVQQQALLAAQLETALQSRIVIEQAKGALAQQQRISVDDAFALLRRHARSRQRLLTAVAQEVLDGTVELFPSESTD